MSGGGPLDAGAGAEELRRRAPALRPRVQLVLGSGLGSLAAAVDEPEEVPFGAVPGLPAAAVAGHAGRFVLGRLEGGAVLVQAGRFHLYEGHGPGRVTAPVRIGAHLGVQTVVVTNAAGGIRRGLGAGSLLLLDDQIDLTFRTLRAAPIAESRAGHGGGAAGEDRDPAGHGGPAPPRGRSLPAHPPYDRRLQRLATTTAARQGIRLPRGTYAGVLGPSYETPAEIRMLSRLGADAVGMSTVLEVAEARARGAAVLGLSLITNRAAGLGGGPLGHDEVVATAERTGNRLERVVRGVLRRLFAAGGGREPSREADPRGREP